MLQLIPDSLAIYLQYHLTCLGFCHIQIDQQVVGTVQTDDGVDGNTRIVCRDIGITHILAIDHQLERGVLHPNIPVCRFDTVNLNCRICGQDHTAEDTYSHSIS